MKAVKHVRELPHAKFLPDSALSNPESSEKAAPFLRSAADVPSADAPLSQIPALSADEAEAAGVSAGVAAPVANTPAADETPIPAPDEPPALLEPDNPPAPAPDEPPALSAPDGAAFAAAGSTAESTAAQRPPRAGRTPRTRFGRILSLSVRLWQKERRRIPRFARVLYACGGLLSLLFLAGAVVYSAWSLSGSVLLEVRLDGTPVGYVESNREIQKAVRSFEEEMSLALNRPYVFEGRFAYTPAVVSADRLSSGDDLREALYQKVKDRYLRACRLYVDGRPTAVVQDEATAELVLDLITDEKNHLLTGENERLELRSTVRFENCVCPRDKMTSAGELYLLLTAGDSSLANSREIVRAVALTGGQSEDAGSGGGAGSGSAPADGKPAGNSAESGSAESGSAENSSAENGSVTSDSTAGDSAESDAAAGDRPALLQKPILFQTQLPPFSQNYLNESSLYFNNHFNNQSSAQTGTASAPLLSFLLISYEYEKVEEPFETIYEYSADYYEGTETVRQEGSDGLRVDTYLLQTLDGTLLQRTCISISYEVERQDKIIVRGTRERKATGSFLWPRKGIITSPVGDRFLFNETNTHRGIDINAAMGDPIAAADGGVVVFAGERDTYGNLTIIDHGNGFESYYAHQSKILVSVGDKIYQGQIIGLVGDTGRVTAPHLHFELHKNGQVVDPLKYLPKQ